MTTHYGWVVLAVLLALALVLFLILKNREDRKEFEEGASQSELPPEKHDDERQ